MSVYLSDEHPLNRCDIAIIGAGAAGLFASIWAGRTLRAATSPERQRVGSVLALDGATKLGAKILVAGGGRCNVTHHAVDEAAYAGSSRNAIKKVLRRFDVPQTVQFFRERGVELKREDTGKLFPTTDDAHTVLDALLAAAADAGASLLTAHKVSVVRTNGDLFLVEHSRGEFLARRIILATGGKSLPKTGSDGHGHELAKSLGHTITPRVFPALVPLTIPKDHWLTSLSGVTLPATLELRAKSGKKLQSFTNSTLVTHFGLSGPSVLDMSRYYTAEKLDNPHDPPRLVMNWIPGESLDVLDAFLAAEGRRAGTTVRRSLEGKLPERVLTALAASVGLELGASLATMPKDKRRALAAAITELELPITGDRGYLFAEVTAGGVPLSEIYLDTMESRVCPGLHLCGEICDVDGRIGGFNFQWAWASGYVAGCGAANGLSTTLAP